MLKNHYVDQPYLKPFVNVLEDIAMMLIPHYMIEPPIMDKFTQQWLDYFKQVATNSAAERQEETTVPDLSTELVLYTDLYLMVQSGLAGFVDARHLRVHFHYVKIQDEVIKYETKGCLMLGVYASS